MFSLKNYKFGFDVFGLSLFLAVMLPNFIWFAVPAANDILRQESVTPLLDAVASVTQIFMVAALCILINKKAERPVKKSILTILAVLIILYFACWCLYYVGIVSEFAVLCLCAFPCAVFILFSAARKNAFALISASIFTVCHLIFGVANFII